VSELTVSEWQDRRSAWRLKADNGEIVATYGGEGYQDEDFWQFMADEPPEQRPHDGRSAATAPSAPPPVWISTIDIQLRSRWRDGHNDHFQGRHCDDYGRA
jgi:hypothetical protein